MIMMIIKIIIIIVIIIIILTPRCRLPCTHEWIQDAHPPRLPHSGHNGMSRAAHVKHAGGAGHDGCGRPGRWLTRGASFAMPLRIASKSPCERQQVDDSWNGGARAVALFLLFSFIPFYLTFSFGRFGPFLVPIFLSFIRFICLVIFNFFSAIPIKKDHL